MNRAGSETAARIYRLDSKEFVGAVLLSDTASVVFQLQELL